jgi:predicted nucleic acid-binding protein
VKYFVLDASVWVARLVTQDEFHQAVKEWMAFQRQEDGQFVSPSLLLAEVAGAISRRTNASFGRRALHQLNILPGLRIVDMNNALIHAAADLAANLGLRGADSVYVAVAMQLEIPLLTFDVEQKERASTAIEVTDIHL